LPFEKTGKVNNMKSLIRLLSLLTITVFFFTSCEGPMGPAGQDANETCKLCHNPSVVDQKVVEFKFSKHQYGEAAFDEAGNTACAPCHESEGFKYVCKNNVAATFTLNTTTGKYSNDYAATTSIAYGELSCFTCHSNLHSTYEYSNFFPLTTTAAVPMTMWKGLKTIDLSQKDGESNLCVRCHQPRPLTTSTTLSNGDVVDYSSLVSSPTALFYDNTVGNAAPNKILPSYRMHVHYGTVGAIYAGQGGIQLTGTLTYENSAHTSVASCQDCHMAPITGKAGGHTFGAIGNFNGCNSCHSTPITSSSTAFWSTPRTEIKNLLNSLAAKINTAGGGTDILHKDASAETNLWAGFTSNNYDGYLDIYSSSSNPPGYWKDPAGSGSTNSGKPVFPSLKNVQIGAIINFQLCLRESSLGIHNYKYTKALLQNSIDALTAAGY
jgi:hypothetical protein